MQGFPYPSSALLNIVDQMRYITQPTPLSKIPEMGRFSCQPSNPNKQIPKFDSCSRGRNASGLWNVGLKVANEEDTAVRGIQWYYLVQGFIAFDASI